LTPPQEIAGEVDRHLDQPGPQRFIDAAWRALDHPNEGVLHEVLGVGCAASHPVAEAP